MLIHTSLIEVYFTLYMYLYNFIFVVKKSFNFSSIRVEFKRLKVIVDNIFTTTTSHRIVQVIGMGVLYRLWKKWGVLNSTPIISIVEELDFSSINVVFNQLCKLNLHPCGVNISYAIMALLLLIVLLLIFLIKNIYLILLSILGLIFIWALMLNFVKKHFIFHNSNKRLNFRIYLQMIVDNTLEIIKFFIKLFMITIVIVIIMRSSVAFLLNGNNSNISNILILILPLPIILYLLNFVIKYIKKQEISPEDYYLYNDFVVERVNLYRIIYIISINYIVRHYYYYYMCVAVIVFGLLSLMLILLLMKKAYKSGAAPPAVNNRIVLQSKAGVVTPAVITSFLAISPILQDSANQGFEEFYSNTGNKRYIGWRKVFYKNPGVAFKGDTINIFENKKSDGFILNDPSTLNRVDEYKQKIANSPVLNIAYRFKNNYATGGLPSCWSIRPLSFFGNDKIQGSVSIALGPRFLIINIFRRDLEGCIFMPSYYLPDGTSDFKFTKLIPTIDILENKYDILLPRNDDRWNGLVIYTQAESVGTEGLFKVWRPSIYYTEPQQMKVKDYYGLEARSKTVGVTPARIHIKDHTLDRSRYIYPEKEHNDRRQLALIAKNEVILDNWFRYMVSEFIRNPIENSSCFYMEDGDDPLLGVPIEKVHGYLSKFKQTEFSRTKIDWRRDWRKRPDFFVKHFTEMADKLFSNNQYFDKKGARLEGRRDYPVNAEILESGFHPSAYIRIYKTGMIEGYKAKNQTLGFYDEEFHVPLHESRIDLIKAIKNKYNGARLEKINAVSVNRLTFEMFEFRLNRDEWGVWLKDDDYDGEIKDNCEVFSIIDTFNDNIKLPLTLHDGIHNFTVLKHDYNFFNWKDDFSIRKFLDFIVRRPGDEFYFGSDKLHDIMNEDTMKVIREEELEAEKEAAENRKSRIGIIERSFKDLDTTVKVEKWLKSGTYRPEKCISDPVHGIEPPAPKPKPQYRYDPATDPNPPTAEQKRQERANRWLQIERGAARGNKKHIRMVEAANARKAAKEAKEVAQEEAKAAKAAALEDARAAKIAEIVAKARAKREVKEAKIIEIEEAIVAKEEAKAAKEIAKAEAATTKECAKAIKADERAKKVIAEAEGKAARQAGIADRAEVRAARAAGRAAKCQGRVVAQVTKARQEAERAVIVRARANAAAEALKAIRKSERLKFNTLSEKATEVGLIELELKAVKAAEAEEAAEALKVARAARAEAERAAEAAEVAKATRGSAKDKGVAKPKRVINKGKKVIKSEPGLSREREVVPISNRNETIVIPSDDSDSDDSVNSNITNPELNSRVLRRAEAAIKYINAQRGDGSSHVMEDSINYFNNVHRSPSDNMSVIEEEVHDAPGDDLPVNNRVIDHANVNGWHSGDGWIIEEDIYGASDDDLPVNNTVIDAGSMDDHTQKSVESASVDLGDHAMNLPPIDDSNLNQSDSNLNQSDNNLYPFDGNIGIGEYGEDRDMNIFEEDNINTDLPESYLDFDPCGYDVDLCPPGYSP